MKIKIAFEIDGKKTKEGTLSEGGFEYSDHRPSENEAISILRSHFKRLGEKIALVFFKEYRDGTAYFKILEGQKSIGVLIVREMEEQKTWAIVDSEKATYVTVVASSVKIDQSARIATVYGGGTGYPIRVPNADEVIEASLVKCLGRNYERAN